MTEQQTFELYANNIVRMTNEVEHDPQQFKTLCDMTEIFWYRFFVKDNRLLDFQDLISFTEWLDDTTGKGMVVVGVSKYIAEKIYGLSDYLRKKDSFEPKRYLTRN